jgi:hypothetical protein
MEGLEKYVGHLRGKVKVAVFEPFITGKGQTMKYGC